MTATLAPERCSYCGNPTGESFDPEEHATQPDPNARCSNCIGLTAVNRTEAHQLNQPVIQPPPARDHRIDLFAEEPVDPEDEGPTWACANCGHNEVVYVEDQRSWSATHTPEPDGEGGFRVSWPETGYDMDTRDSWTECANCGSRDVGMVEVVW